MDLLITGWNQFNLVETSQNWSEQVATNMTNQNQSEPVRPTYGNQLELVKTRRNLLEAVITGGNQLELVITRRNQ